MKEVREAVESGHHVVLHLDPAFADDLTGPLREQVADGHVTVEPDAGAR